MNCVLIRMYDITEKGLRAKWTSEALEFGWKFYQGESQYIHIGRNHRFSVSNTKIAIGPLILGSIFSLFVFIYEIIVK